MKLTNCCLALLLFVMGMAVATCSKPSEADGADDSGDTNLPIDTALPIDTTPPSGNVAQFDTISFPMLQLQVTNAYSIVCTNQGLYARLRYNGGIIFGKYVTQADSGTWVYPSDPFYTRYMSSMDPLNQYSETKEEIAYTWTTIYPMSGNFYGVNHSYNGKTSKRFRLKGYIDSTQPSSFNQVLVPSAGQGKCWGVAANEIWRESEDPETFRSLFHGSGWRIYNAYLDPDDENVFWCTVLDSFYWTGNYYETVSKSKVYKITDGASTEVKLWDLSEVGKGTIVGIVKLKGKIYLQKGNQILVLDDAIAKIIGTITPNATKTATFTSNGQYLFVTDGNYYNPTTDNWKPFIGSGQNLNTTESARSDTLKSYLNQSWAIAATQGGGPIYLLREKKLVRIDPKL